jgi:hypothetical protein
VRLVEYPEAPASSSDASQRDRAARASDGVLEESAFTAARHLAALLVAQSAAGAFAEGAADSQAVIDAQWHDQMREERLAGAQGRAVAGSLHTSAASAEAAMIAAADAATARLVGASEKAVAWLHKVERDTLVQAERERREEEERSAAAAAAAAEAAAAEAAARAAAEASARAAAEVEARLAAEAATRAAAELAATQARAAAAAITATAAASAVGASGRAPVSQGSTAAAPAPPPSQHPNQNPGALEDEDPTAHRPSGAAATAAAPSAEGFLETARRLVREVEITQTIMVDKLGLRPTAGESAEQQALAAAFAPLLRESTVHRVVTPCHSLQPLPMGQKP